MTYIHKFLFCLTALLLYTTNPLIAQSLLTITADMVHAESESNPEVLFDNNLETFWTAGWDPDAYNAYAYVDLGGEYDISEIQLWDFTGDGQIKIYTGELGNWNGDVIVVDALTKYNKWITHPVNTTTSYLRFRIKTVRSRVGEIRIYGSPTGTTNEEITFDNIAPVDIIAENTTTITVTANNANNLWANSIPGFVSFSNHGNGTGTLTISPTAEIEGTYTVNLNATNDNGQSETMVVTINVSAADTDEPSDEESICEVVLTSLITGGGNPGALVDEQDEINDPANGPGGNPDNYWFAGWKSYNYPAEGYLDLGSVKQLTRIFIRDIQGQGTVRIYQGSPGNWNNQPLIVDDLSGYQVWNEHSTAVNTRYLKVQLEDPSARIGELAIYGYCNNPTPDNEAPAMITNLSATAATSSTTTLTWTAPGDDGNSGMANAYDLRYSTTPINNSNFNEAIVFPAAGPQPSGTNTTATITGLSCNVRHYFAIKTTDDAGNTSGMSNSTNRKTSLCNTTATQTITLNLSNNVVGTPAVNKATLKYDKDFAYSLTLDDGSVSFYYLIFPLLQGGVSAYPNDNPDKPWLDFPNVPTINEPGLNFSDGCGNEIKFKAGLAINGDRMRENIERERMTWDNLREMYQADWDILNHSFTHCSNGCNYDEEITQNTDIIEQYLGFTTTHFVVPSGIEEFYEPAYDNSMVALYDQSFGMPGKFGYQVDGLLPEGEFELFRNALQNDNAPYGDKIDDVADLSGNGNHYWFAEFSHRIGYQGTDDYLEVYYDDFKDYMEYLEDEYGHPWSDKKIWFAPLQEVYEYLKVRDHTGISVEKPSANQIRINLDTNDVPGMLRRQTLTLKVDLPSGVTIQNVVTANVNMESYNPTTGLLNISWE